MTHENYTHIQIKKRTKESLDKTRFSMQVKLKQIISQNKIIEILLNTYKDFTRLNTELTNAKEKIHALENYIERLENGEKIE